MGGVNRVLVVDGHNLVMRSLKAMQGHQTMLSSNGINTGPLLVFVRMFNRYVRHVRPTHVVVCWDTRPSWRENLEPSYKANRHHRTAEEDSERNDAFSLARRWLSLTNVMHTESAGYEADDLVAAYVRRYRARGGDPLRRQGSVAARVTWDHSDSPPVHTYARGRNMGCGPDYQPIRVVWQ